MQCSILRNKSIPELSAEKLKCMFSGSSSQVLLAIHFLLPNAKIPFPAGKSLPTLSELRVQIASATLNLCIAWLCKTAPTADWETQMEVFPVQAGVKD